MNNLSYDKAFEELQEILQQIEEGDITLDTLSEKVKRAHVLIQHCQTKFKEVENEVANILTEIKEDNADEIEKKD
ncbi:MAG TPA: exodeoxyribonuclease VII small subunit [Chitinophagaceae bacterium]|nr:exodeoxyribonuclease VII small subunit [Chitinophagaceae bacterium]